jgi:hypothetical protein
MKRAIGYVSQARAIDILLHRDGRLVEMHSGCGREWFILPGGGRVKPTDAFKIVGRPDIIGNEDGLFPGVSQTWRRA